MGEPENIALMSQKFYILREDKVGKIVPKGRMSYLRHNLAEKVINTEAVYQALRGDLFQRLGPDKQPEDLQKIAVTSIDYENKELEADLSVFSEISEDVKDLLFPVASSNERYKIFTSRDSIERALNLKKGEPVTVKIKGKREQPGSHRYTGRIQKKKGTFFGVQLEVRFWYKLHFNLTLV